MCDCNIGPGKFEGEGVETYLAWMMVMGGGGDEITGGEYGDGPTTDWIASPEFCTDKDAVADALAYGYCQECIDFADSWRPAGMAVWETDQGFVGSRVFETQEAYDKALAECQDADEAMQERCESCGDDDNVGDDGFCDDCHDKAMADETDKA